MAGLAREMGVTRTKTVVATAAAGAASHARIEQSFCAAAPSPLQLLLLSGVLRDWRWCTGQ